MQKISKLLKKFFFFLLLGLKSKEGQKMQRTVILFSLFQGMTRVSCAYSQSPKWDTIYALTVEKDIQTAPKGQLVS